MFFVLLSISLFLPLFSCANDQIIVSATREDASASDLPFSVGRIEGNEWEEKGEINALSQISGLSISSSGGPGQTRSLFLRGAKSEHVLVLVDGIIVNDPIAPSRGFDFGQIPTEEIDRIEIIKGPQSVLFGSDAMGGVIQIFTKRSLSTPKIKLSGGSYGTAKANIAAYGFHAAYERSDGFSAADKRDGNQEPDGNRAYRIGGVKDFNLDQRTTLRNTALLTDEKTDTDRAGGVGGDSRNTFTRSSRLQFRSELIHIFENGIDTELSGSTNIIDREDNTLGAAFYKANLWKVESLWRKSVGIHNLVFAGEYTQETGRSSDLPEERSLYSYGVFLQDHFVRGRLHGSLGARIDFPSEQGNPQTYRSGLGYWIIPERWKTKINIGTGFKAPSLYQTYSSYGMRGLAAEKSIGGDIGLEFYSEHFESDLSWYQNRFQNLIEFNSVSSKYYNLGRTETYGIETSLAYIYGRLKIKNAFTTTHAIDTQTKQQLLRRPSWNNSINASWQENAVWNFGAQARMVGPREDLHPILYTRETMPAYLVVGANIRAKMNPKTQATLRVDNLLNHHYQEISGYGTAGFSAYAGLELEL